MGFQSLEECGHRLSSRDTRRLYVRQQPGRHGWRQYVYLLYTADRSCTLSGDPSDRTALSCQLLATVDAVGAWMASNPLRLNQDKTQFLKIQMKMMAMVMVVVVSSQKLDRQA